MIVGKQSKARTALHLSEFKVTRTPKATFWHSISFASCPIDILPFTDAGVLSSTPFASASAQASPNRQGTWDRELEGGNWNWGQGTGGRELG